MQLRSNVIDYIKEDSRKKVDIANISHVILLQKTGVLAVDGRNRRKYKVPFYIVLKACAVSGNCKLSSCIKYSDV